MMRRFGSERFWQILDYVLFAIALIFLWVSVHNRWYVGDIILWGVLTVLFRINMLQDSTRVDKGA
jgi:hypothetical protein